MNYNPNQTLPEMNRYESLNLTKNDISELNSIIEIKDLINERQMMTRMDNENKNTSFSGLEIR